MLSGGLLLLSTAIILPARHYRNTFIWLLAVDAADLPDFQVIAW